MDGLGGSRGYDEKSRGGGGEEVGGGSWLVEEMIWEDGWRRGEHGVGWGRGTEDSFSSLQDIYVEPISRIFIQIVRLCCNLLCLLWNLLWSVAPISHLTVNNSALTIHPQFVNEMSDFCGQNLVAPWISWVNPSVYHCTTLHCRVQSDTHRLIRLRDYCEFYYCQSHKVLSELSIFPWRMCLYSLSCNKET